MPSTSWCRKGSGSPSCLNTWSQLLTSMTLLSQKIFRGVNLWGNSRLLPSTDTVEWAIQFSKSGTFEIKWQSTPAMTQSCASHFHPTWRTRYQIGSTPSLYALFTTHGGHWGLSHTIRLSPRSQKKQSSPLLRQDDAGRQPQMIHQLLPMPASQILQLWWVDLRTHIHQRVVGHVPSVQASLKAQHCQDKWGPFSGLHLSRRRWRCLDTYIA